MYCHVLSTHVSTLPRRLQVGDLEGILEGLSDSEHAVHREISQLVPSSKLVNSTDVEIQRMLRQISLILQSLTRVCLIAPVLSVDYTILGEKCALVSSDLKNSPRYNCCVAPTDILFVFWLMKINFVS